MLGADWPPCLQLGEPGPALRGQLAEGGRWWSPGSEQQHGPDAHHCYQGDPPHSAGLHQAPAGHLQGEAALAVWGAGSGVPWGGEGTLPLACFPKHESQPAPGLACPSLLGAPPPASPSPPACSEVTLQAKGQAACYSFRWKLLGSPPSLAQIPSPFNTVVEVSPVQWETKPAKAPWSRVLGVSPRISWGQSRGQR